MDCNNALAVLYLCTGAALIGGLATVVTKADISRYNEKKRAEYIGKGLDYVEANARVLSELERGVQN